METRQFKNTELEKAVAIAKENGYKVWTAEPSHQNAQITYVFFDNGKTFGYAQAEWDLLKYNTCHKANKECGTGFGVYDDAKPAGLEYIEATFAMAPAWAYSRYAKHIVKQSFEQYQKGPGSLKYYEL